MTTAAMNIDYREFEKAGFTKEQTDVLKTVISVIEDSGLHDEVVKREIDASESRLENALVRELSKVKEEIKKEMHLLEKNLTEKIYSVETSQRRTKVQSVDIWVLSFNVAETSECDIFLDQTLHNISMW